MAPWLVGIVEMEIGGPEPTGGRLGGVCGDNEGPPGVRVEPGSPPATGSPARPLMSRCLDIATFRPRSKAGQGLGRITHAHRDTRAGRPWHGQGRRRHARGDRVGRHGLVRLHLARGGLGERLGRRAGQHRSGSRHEGVTRLWLVLLRSIGSLGAPSAFGGACHVKASSWPEIGETGSQVCEATPSAIQRGSRGARAARESHSRARPDWAPCSASSIAAIIRQVRTVGPSRVRGWIASRARPNSRASRAAWATARRDSGSQDEILARFSARASRSRTESPVRRPR